MTVDAEPTYVRVRNWWNTFDTEFEALVKEKPDKKPDIIMIILPMKGALFKVVARENQI